MKKDPYTIVLNLKSKTKKTKKAIKWDIKIINNRFLSLLNEDFDFNIVWSRPSFKIEERIIAWENFWK